MAIGDGRRKEEEGEVDEGLLTSFHKGDTQMGHTLHDLLLFSHSASLYQHFSSPRLCFHRMNQLILYTPDIRIIT